MLPARRIIVCSKNTPFCAKRSRIFRRMKALSRRSTLCGIPRTASLFSSPPFLHRVHTTAVFGSTKRMSRVFGKKSAPMIFVRDMVWIRIGSMPLCPFRTRGSPFRTGIATLRFPTFMTSARKRIVSSTGILSSSDRKNRYKPRTFARGL